MSEPVSDEVIVAKVLEAAVYEILGRMYRGFEENPVMCECMMQRGRQCNAHALSSQFK